MWCIDYSLTLEACWVCHCIESYKMLYSTAWKCSLGCVFMTMMKTETFLGTAFSLRFSLSPHLHLAPQHSSSDVCIIYGRLLCKSVHRLDVYLPFNGWNTEVVWWGKEQVQKVDLVHHPTRTVKRSSAARHLRKYCPEFVWMFQV